MFKVVATNVSYLGTSRPGAGEVGVIFQLVTWIGTLDLPFNLSVVICNHFSPPHTQIYRDGWGIVGLGNLFMFLDFYPIENGVLQLYKDLRAWLRAGLEEFYQLVPTGLGLYQGTKT